MTVENTTTATYLLNFIADLKQLTDNFCAYNNYLLYLKTKFTPTEPATAEKVQELLSEKKLDADELKGLQEIANNIRYWATQTYLKQMGFSKKIKEIENAKPELEKLYKEIQQTLIPTFETVQAYCVLNHELFATSALNEIIVKTQQYYEQVSGLNESLP